MEALQRREDISRIQLPHDQAVQERWAQMGVLAGGACTYLVTHKILRDRVFTNRPVVPQFIAILPALALVYVGGLIVRMKTLKREGLLS
jgi:hypothetical protein